MARTVRNVTHAGYLRHIKTHNEAAAYFRSVFEAEETPEYRHRHRRVPRSTLPDAWEDIPLSCYREARLHRR
jgi:hypothetical protein